MATTIGAPISEVMTLIGTTWEGSRDRIEQHRAAAAPVRMLAGIRWRWSEVPTRRRAACGTAIPRKPIGPQKAVTAPVSRHAPISTPARAAATLTPIVRA